MYLHAMRVHPYFLLDENRLGQWIGARWGDSPAEATGIVTLGEANKAGRRRFIAEHLIACGGEHEVCASTEQLVRAAVLDGACAAALWHLHPSGANHFSPADVKAAQEFIRALKVCNVEFAGGFLIYSGQIHFVSGGDFLKFDVDQILKGQQGTEIDGKLVFEHKPGDPFMEYLLRRQKEGV